MIWPIECLLGISSLFLGVPGSPVGRITALHVGWLTTGMVDHHVQMRLFHLSGYRRCLECESEDLLRG